MDTSSAAGGGAPPPLLLAPLLQDLHAWLSSPTLGGSSPLPSPSLNPAGTASAAMRASSALFNFLPAGSRGATPPPPTAEGDGGRSSSTAAADGEPAKKKKVKCRCVEAYGNNLYIGTSDGQVLWYTYDAAGSEPYTLRHRHNIFPRRAITSIHLLPSISKALILSETTLHFVALPTLEPVPTGLIQSVRGVVAVAVDEGPEGVEGEKNVCVIKRKGIGIFRLSTRLFHVKDVPLPEPPVLARYHHPYLCISDLDTYSLVSLLEATLSPVLPVSQLADPNDLPFRVRPNIAVVQEDEFLITSCVNANGIGGTVGVFMTGEGDPVRGTVEWEENPRSIVVQPPYIIALLRSGAVQVHSLLTLESIQTIPAPANIDPKQVSLSQSGFTVPARERDAQLRKVSVPLFKLEPALRAVVGDSLQLGGFDEPSGSGLTPPASPIQGRSTFDSSSRPAASSNRSLPPSTATQLSQVLLLSSSSAWSLTTTPALSLALQVLDSAPSSPSLLLEALGPLMMNAATVGEQDDAAVRFVHQKVFLRGLRDARFGGFTSESTSGDADQETLGPEQAELWALAGGDYRLVLRLFVEMRPILAALVTGKDDVPSVEAGLAEEWQELWDIDEIIRARLRRNYEPHLEQNIEEAPEALEMHKALLDQARAMLRAILTSERESRLRIERGKGRGWTRSSGEELAGKIVDTCLLVLLAQIGSTSDVLRVMDSTNLADLALVQTALREHERWYALAQSSSDLEALALYVDMVEGVKPNPDCPEPPLASILKLVARTDDVELVRRYGKWLVGQASVDSSAVWAAIGGDAFGSRSKENEQARRSLLMGLVKQRVKLDKEPASASRLLNRHSLHLDLMEVVPHVPDEWPLRNISPFVVRSLRKDFQRREEGQILKAISASLNLRVIDHALDAFARCPPVVEDGPPPGERGADEKPTVSGAASEAEKAGILRRLMNDVPRTITPSDAQKEQTTTAHDESDELDEIA